MKGIDMKIVLLICLVMVAGTVLPHTQQETNSVVRSMLRQSWEYSLKLSHGDWSVFNWPAKPDTWQGFLELGINDGWQPSEKESAFDWYMENMGGHFDSAMSQETKNLLNVAVSACSTHIHTNAFPALRQLTSRSTGRLREKVIGAAVKCAPIDESLTDYVRGILTNAVEFTYRERGIAINGLRQRMEGLEVGNPVRADAVRLFYRSRDDVFTSIGCDMALTNRLDGYAISSNRLELACRMLAQTNLQFFVDYYVGVTNEILSSGRPLRQLNIGEEYPKE